MALDKFLLDILVCPATKEPLALLPEGSLHALNNLIREGKVKNCAGALVQEGLDAGLLRSDRKVIYPVRRDIPIMLPEEGLPIDGLGLSL